jgi:hypothetical protein
MLRHQLLAAVQLVLLTHLSSIILANEVRSSPQFELPLERLTGVTGLLINRLSDKELEQWRAIERLVFEEDNERQPLHPTLRLLWEWIDTSGHEVYIEVIRMNRVTTCTAGNFSIENFDPTGERHVAVIKLNLPNIDHAYVGPRASRANGFIPFTDLNKEERYAEVLGHEMAHAVHILTSLERTKKVIDYVEHTNEILLTQYSRQKTGPLAPELKQRLSKRDALLKELEAKAEEMEHVVWKELIASRQKREKRIDE